MLAVHKRAAPRALTWFACSPVVIPALLLLNVAMHLFWAVKRLRPYTSEMHQIAVTLAKTGTIASAYRLDNIPTTHVGPIAPVPGAVVYWLFGADTHAAEFVLTVVAALTVAALLYLLTRVFAALGESPLACRLALAAVTFLPVDIEMEAQDFRIREGAYAATTITFLLLCLLRLDRRGGARWTDIWLTAALAAFLFLLSPAAGLAAYAACGVFVLRNMPWKQWPLVALVAAGVLIAASFPWALRNHVDRGEWVWSRGNAGLELGVGSYPGAVDPADPPKAFRERLKEIHPYKSKAAYDRMMAEGGEVVYAHRIGQQAWAWAGSHPGQALGVWLRHVREFYAPPYWLWAAYGGHVRAQLLREWWTTFNALVAAVTLLWFLWRRRTRYWYLFAILVTASLPYIVGQPRVRYRYTISYLLIFLSICGIVRFLRWAVRQVGGSARHDGPADGRSETVHLAGAASGQP